MMWQLPPSQLVSQSRGPPRAVQRQQGVELRRAEVHPRVGCLLWRRRRKWCIGSRLPDCRIRCTPPPLVIRRSCRRAAGARLPHPINAAAICSPVTVRPAAGVSAVVVRPQTRHRTGRPAAVSRSAAPTAAVFPGHVGVQPPAAAHLWRAASALPLSLWPVPLLVGWQLRRSPACTGIAAARIRIGLACARGPAPAAACSPAVTGTSVCVAVLPLGHWAVLPLPAAALPGPAPSLRVSCPVAASGDVPAAVC